MFEVEQNLTMLENGIQMAQSKEEEDIKRFSKEIADEVPKLNKRIQARPTIGVDGLGCSNDSLPSALPVAPFPVLTIVLRDEGRILLD